jgi:hypothetical protein
VSALYNVFCTTSVSTLVMTYSAPAFYQYDVLFNVPITVKWITNYNTLDIPTPKILFNNDINDMIISIYKDDEIF